MSRMSFVLLLAFLVFPGEMWPDGVGGVDGVEDVVRVGERVVTPAPASQAHPPLLLLLLSRPGRAQEWERQEEIFPVHCSVIRPPLSVLIVTVTVTQPAPAHLPQSLRPSEPLDSS